MFHGQTLAIHTDDLRPILERHFREVIFRDGQCPPIKEVQPPRYSYDSQLKVIFADAPEPPAEVGTTDTEPQTQAA